VPTPPQAELDYAEIGAESPMHVEFDASASTDPDGIVVRYEWDFDGDGIFEYDGGAARRTDFYYWEPGSFETTVRVTDDDGLSDTAGVSVDVEEDAEWWVTTAREDVYGDHEEPRSGLVSLLEVAGAPAILYEHPVDGGFDQLTYIRALSAAAEDWSEPLMIADEGEGYSPYRPGFAIIAGRPAMASVDRYYCRALDSEGTSWPAPQPYSGSMSGSRTILAVGGLPAIVDCTGYHVAADADGTSWEKVFSFIDFPLHNINRAATTVDGKPVLVAQLITNHLLAYSSAYDSGGTNWRVPSVAADIGEPPYDWKVALVDAAGHPAIAYANETYYTLEYRRALDPEGTAWGEALILDHRSNGWLSMTVFDGRPAIVYSGPGGNRFRAANDDEGRSWGFPMVMDVPVEGVNHDHPLVLAVVDGRLAVAWRPLLPEGESDTRWPVMYAEYR